MFSLCFQIFSQNVKLFLYPSVTVSQKTASSHKVVKIMHFKGLLLRLTLICLFWKTSWKLRLCFIEIHILTVMIIESVKCSIKYLWCIKMSLEPHIYDFCPRIDAAWIHWFNGHTVVLLFSTSHKYPKYMNSAPSTPSFSIQAGEMYYLSGWLKWHHFSSSSSTTNLVLHLTILGTLSKRGPVGVAESK